jgi:hypothetical protein
MAWRVVRSLSIPSPLVVALARNAQVLHDRGLSGGERHESLSMIVERSRVLIQDAYALIEGLTMLDHAVDTLI